MKWGAVLRPVLAPIAAIFGALSTVWPTWNRHPAVVARREFCPFIMDDLNEIAGSRRCAIPHKLTRLSGLATIGVAGRCWQCRRPCACDPSANESEVEHPFRLARFQVVVVGAGANLSLHRELGSSGSSGTTATDRD